MPPLRRWCATRVIISGIEPGTARDFRRRKCPENPWNPVGENVYSGECPTLPTQSG